MDITQNMYNITKQRTRELYLSVEVLNSNFLIIDNFQGNIIDGTINIDANSDIRRTCNINLIVTDSTFEIKPDGKIWIDKYVKIYIGIKSIRTNEIEWFNQGMYIIDAPSWNYNGSDNTISFNGIDLMAKLTGLRNGNLIGLPFVIPQNSNVRQVMISLLTQYTNFKQYVIDEFEMTTPYEIKVGETSNIYEILSHLRDIVPNWQIYFDINGVFHFNKIPSGKNEPILIDDDTWNDLKLNEQVNIDFNKIKNMIEIWGRSLTPAHFGDSSINGDTYVVSMSNVTSLSDNLLYGFTIKDVLVAPKLKINQLSALPIVDDFNNPIVLPENNQYYIVKYVQKNNNFLFLGYQRPHAISEDNNINSPFYINGPVGTIRQVYSGGEFDNITSNNLCKQRADWELYKATSLENNLVLTTVPIYYLDVNIMSSYTNKDNNKYEYIIKSISTDLSAQGTQSITMNKYYPLYNYI